jgi:hypothetical protein
MYQGYKPTRAAWAEYLQLESIHASVIEEDPRLSREKLGLGVGQWCLARDSDQAACQGGLRYLCVESVSMHRIRRKPSEDIVYTVWTYRPMLAIDGNMIALLNQNQSGNVIGPTKRR